MLTIDGAQGEGGGQVLRTSLALAAVTGTPFRIENIRAARRKPGLMRQHLAAALAAARVCGARLEGATLGSTVLTFFPGPVKSGDYAFTVGTAGSATLVLQTVLPPLLTAPGRSRLTLEGGTHNPMAPPFDFLVQSFLPLVNRMGPKVGAKLERWGFYPAGGGRVEVSITPAAALAPFDLLERGAIIAQRARAVVANLPRTIAVRELETARRTLSLEASALQVQEVRDSRGPGNVVMVEIVTESHTEVFTGFGARGVSAEEVAGAAAKEARQYLASGLPVGRHLADQLLVPLALAGKGSFRTSLPSLHATTNIDVIAKFLGPTLRCVEVAERAFDISARS